MSWQTIVALVVVIPIILLPVVVVWYLKTPDVFTRVLGRQKAKSAPQGVRHPLNESRGHRQTNTAG